MDNRNLALSKFNKMNSQIFVLIDQPNLYMLSLIIFPFSQ